MNAETFLGSVSELRDVPDAENLQAFLESKGASDVQIVKQDPQVITSPLSSTVRTPEFDQGLVEAHL